MGQIADNITNLRRIVPENVTVVAVSKTRTDEEVMEAYNAGHRIFGENRVQELTARKATLPTDIEWHLIGHLQTNKVKLAVLSAEMIESVDSLRLFHIINDEAAKAGKTIDCLIQIHIASEETKFGFDPTEAEKVNWISVATDCKNVRLRGLMGIASFTGDKEKVRSEFRALSELFLYIRSTYRNSLASFNILSMGMSDDWKIAVEEGSTMVRVGTLIFGPRKTK